MPEYLYMCACGARLWISHQMDADPDIKCPQCQSTMWRKPQAHAVNWGGLKPSAGELAPAIKNHIDNIDQIREETDKKYYERDQNKTD